MNKLKTICALLFLMLVFSYLIVAEIKKPKIFIVHSYSTTYQWINEINRAIDTTLQDKRYISVRYAYLNSKVHPEKEYLEKAGAAIREKIESWAPDIIIACNDDAQQFVARYFVNKPHINVIFCGVSNDPAAYGYINAKNVTGIIENIAFNTIKQVILDQFPSRKRILHLADGSVTSQSIHKHIMEYQWQPLHLVDSIITNDFAQWQHYIQYAEQYADLIFITHYHTIKDHGNYISPQEVLRWTLANSKVPIIGGFDFFVDDGGAFAVSVSATEQGKTATKLALQVIESHIDAGVIPFVEGSAVGIALREPVYEKSFPQEKIHGVYSSFAKLRCHYYGESTDTCANRTLPF